MESFFKYSGQHQDSTLAYHEVFEAPPIEKTKAAKPHLGTKKRKGKHIPPQSILGNDMTHRFIATGIYEECTCETTGNNHVAKIRK